MCSLGIAMTTAEESRAGQESIVDIQNSSVILVEPNIPKVDLTASDEEEEFPPPKQLKASIADVISHDGTRPNLPETKPERKSRIVRKRKIPRANFKHKPDSKLTCEMCQGPALYCQPNPKDCPHHFCSACVIELLRSTAVCAICQHSIKTLQLHFWTLWINFD